MTLRQLHERITDQFSYRGANAEIWRGFDAILNTQEFLNLGYSKWYQPHIAGSIQLRLARKIGAEITERLPTKDGLRLLDIGCGRGGPSLYLAEAHGFNVTGIDLVPYNVAVARENAAARDVSPEFVVGDAPHLPFKTETFPVCTAIDSVVYLPDKRAFFEEVASVLQDKGLIVISDLVMADDVDGAAEAAVEDYADAWDMPPLLTLGKYQSTIEHAGLTVREIEDITPNSAGRLRKWTTLYLALSNGFAGRAMDRLLQELNIDSANVTDQVRRSHAALPYLRHVIIYIQE